MDDLTMDDLLLGYLLESLDPAARQRVEAELQLRSDARARLARLQAILAPLAEDAADPPPPPGLVLRTVALVAEHQCNRRLPSRADSHPLAAPRFSWGRADVLVAASLLVVVVGLVAPLLSRLWFRHDRYACANNLRKFWTGLSAYADARDGDFPRVEHSGPLSVAGAFVPILAESGLLQDVSVGCPGRGQRQPAPIRISDLERLHADRPDEYSVVARDLAGNYAYSLGYADETTGLRGLRRDSGDGLPILADRGNDRSSNSDNHAGTGQNVLYVGGNVRWATLPTTGLNRDHIYLNYNLRREAGLCRTDTVLGASDARPFLD